MARQTEQIAVQAIAAGRGREVGRCLDNLASKSSLNCVLEGSRRANSHYLPVRPKSIELLFTYILRNIQAGQENAGKW